MTDVAPPLPARQPLKRKLLSGFAWNAAAGASVQLTRLVVGVILARLLSPRDYGLAGMVLVFSGLALALSDLALGAGLVQREEIDEDDRSTVFWTSCATGVVLAAVCAAVSGPVARFYHQPAVRPLLLAFSLTFVIGPLVTTQIALLQREMRFRAIETRTIVGAVSAAVVAVALALAGFGAWALIAQQLTLGAVSAALVWRFSDWRPTRRFSVHSLRTMGGFGFRILGSRLLSYANQNVDNVLVGRFVGAAALGTYALAYNVMLMPLTRLVGPVRETMLPALARAQNDLPRLAELWLRANRMLTALMLPATLGLVVVAPDLVPVVLGSRWAGVTRVLQLLAIAAPLRSAFALCSAVLTALGRAGTLLRCTILASILQIGGFVVGLHWGIVGVAASFAIANALLAPVYVGVTARAAGLTALQVVGQLRGVIEASALMLAAVVGARHALVYAGESPALRLVELIALGTLVYVPACLLRSSAIVAELRSLAALRRARPASA